MKQTLFFALLFFLAKSVLAAPQVRVFLDDKQHFTLPEGSYKIMSQGQKVLLNEAVTIQWEEKGYAQVNGNSLPCPLALYSSKPIRFQKRRYRGFFRFFCTKSSIKAVNVVALEDYVKGVMKMEIAPYFETEAQKAQAVVARTYALYKKQYHKKDLYDVVATVMDQVYGGINGEDAVLNRAVEATARQVLMYRGKPAFTVYHSESGGITEDPKDVWGNAFPYLKPRRIPFSVHSPRAHWKVFLTPAQLKAALRKMGYAIQEVGRMSIQQRTASGRVGRVRFQTNQGVLSVKGAALRLALGPSLLKSTLFKVIFRPFSLESAVLPLERQVFIDEAHQKVPLSPLYASDGFVAFQPPTHAVTLRRQEQGYWLQGRGWGHGVGLGQWDANAMAKRGYSYKQILSFFYTGTSLEKI